MLSVSSHELGGELLVLFLPSAAQGSEVITETLLRAHCLFDDATPVYTPHRPDLITFVEKSLRMDWRIAVFQYVKNRSSKESYAARRPASIPPT